jgi:hypothetical protein
MFHWWRSARRATDYLLSIVHRLLSDALGSDAAKAALA